MGKFKYDKNVELLDQPLSLLKQKLVTRSGVNFRMFENKITIMMTSHRLHLSF